MVKAFFFQYGYWGLSRSDCPAWHPLEVEKTLSLSMSCSKISIFNFWCDKYQFQWEKCVFFNFWCDKFNFQASSGCQAGVQRGPAIFKRVGVSRLTSENMFFSNNMKIQAGVKRVWIQAGVKRPKKMFFELSRPKHMIFELDRPKNMFFEPQVAYPRRIFMFLLFVGCRGQDPGPLDLFPVKITPPPPRRIYMTFVGGSVYEGGN